MKIRWTALAIDAYKRAGVEMESLGLKAIREIKDPDCGTVFTIWGGRQTVIMQTWSGADINGAYHAIGAVGVLIRFALGELAFHKPGLDPACPVCNPTLGQDIKVIIRDLERCATQNEGRRRSDREPHPYGVGGVRSGPRGSSRTEARDTATQGGTLMVYGTMDETSNPLPEDPGSRCPTCGKDAGYTFHECDDAETAYYENWLVCKACGARTDEDELIRLRVEARQ